MKSWSPHLLRPGSPLGSLLLWVEGRLFGSVVLMLREESGGGATLHVDAAHVVDTATEAESSTR